MGTAETFWQGPFYHNFIATPLPAGGSVVRQYRLADGLPGAVYTVTAIPWTVVSDNPIRYETVAISPIDVSYVAKPTSGANQNWLYVTFANTGFYQIRFLTVYITVTRKL